MASGSYGPSRMLYAFEPPQGAEEATGADQVAPPVTTPWGDRNARVRAPDGLQLTLFTAG